MKNEIVLPRKKPLQSRSKATVDAIVEAATYVLEREGWTAFNTNRVAQRAGVNIASLYQYFPNKLALVEALRVAHIQAAKTAIVEATQATTDPIVSIVRALIAAHKVSPGLHRVFTEELPAPLGQGAECIEDPALLLIVRPMFSHLDDPELALFIVYHAVHAVIHRAACHQPEMLDRPGFEKELVTIVRAVLRAPNSNTPITSRGRSSK